MFGKVEFKSYPACFSCPPLSLGWWWWSGAPHSRPSCGTTPSDWSTWTSRGRPGCWRGPPPCRSTCTGSSAPGSRCRPRAGTAGWRTWRIETACLDPEQEPNDHVPDHKLRDSYTKTCLRGLDVLEVSHLGPDPRPPRPGLLSLDLREQDGLHPHGVLGVRLAQVDEGEPVVCVRPHVLHPEVVQVYRCTGVQVYSTWSSTTGSVGWCRGRVAAWEQGIENYFCSRNMTAVIAWRSFRGNQFIFRTWRISLVLVYRLLISRVIKL